MNRPAMKNQIRSSMGILRNLIPEITLKFHADAIHPGAINSGIR